MRLRFNAAPDVTTGEAPIGADPRKPGFITALALSRWRYRLALALLLLLVLGYYMWTAASSYPFVFGANLGDIYNLMTTGFLHGHLYLPIQVPTGLEHLKNPYDPTQNAPYQFYHDLALRNGHFYSPWGASPTLLFLLFRLTPVELPESFAVALYGSIGLGCAVGLLHVLLDKFIPYTPSWLKLLASAGLALTNTLPFLLRRPLQYEAAIAGAYCFEMAGLLLVSTAVIACPARLWRLAAGSLMLGLALDARPTLIVGVPIVAVAVLFLIRRRGASYRALIPALVPVLLSGMALGLYNDARFGSPTEIGTNYQIAGIDQRHKPNDQLSYIPPGLFSFLLVPAQLSLTFPHFFLVPMTQSIYPFPLPKGYAGTLTGPGVEPAGGMFPTMPITLLLLGLPLLWRRQRSDRASLLLIGGLSAVAMAVMVIVAFGMYAATQRYEVDYATYALLAAFLLWALLLRRASTRRNRRWIAAVGVVLSAIGATIGIATGITGYSNLLEVEHPGTFQTLEDMTSPLVTAATMIVDKPIITRVVGPLGAELPPFSYTQVTEAGSSTWLGSAGPVWVTVVSPTSRLITLVAVASPGIAGAPPLSDDVVRVAAPGEQSHTVRLTVSPVGFPIRIHVGLNRIMLRLIDPAKAGPQDLFLHSLAIAR